jgi:hypothetical protein
MGIAYLRLGPPPGGGETMRSGQVGRRGTDEGINVVKDAGTLSGAEPPRGFNQMKSHLGVRAG